MKYDNPTISLVTLIKIEVNWCTIEINSKNNGKFDGDSLHFNFFVSDSGNIAINIIIYIYIYIKL